MDYQLDRDATIRDGVPVMRDRDGAVLPWNHRFPDGRTVWGVAFRAVREGGGLLQTDVAARCGVTDRTIQKWESGEAVPGLRKAQWYWAQLTGRRAG